MEKLIVKNFKCFTDIEIPLNQLTVFAGGNGNGKSTAIQGLLLLRNTIEETGEKNDDSKYYDLTNTKKHINIELNGPYCLALGTNYGVLSLNSTEEDNDIVIAIKSESKKIKIKYSSNAYSELHLKSDEITSDMDKDDSILKNSFYYLNAERIGPRLRQSVKPYHFPNTGFKGEYTAQILGDTSFSYSFEVDKIRRFENIENPRIEQQVNAWLNYILPNVEIKSFYDSDLMTAQIKMSNSLTKRTSILSTNIGFGISYVLPIIVTGLIADKDSYFIVENPEAHLHPSAQSKIGEFLSITAMSGVKVIIETHSDHILNGIQIAVAKNTIQSNKVMINYFDNQLDFNQPNVTSILINEKGELSTWPKGFFDQSQRDYAELLNIRRNG